jgi:hypothetical protein
MCAKKEYIAAMNYIAYGKEISLFILGRSNKFDRLFIKITPEA